MCRSLVRVESSLTSPAPNFFAFVFTIISELYLRLSLPVGANNFLNDEQIISTKTRLRNDHFVHDCTLILFSIGILIINWPWERSDSWIFTHIAQPPLQVYRYSTLCLASSRTSQPAVTAGECPSDCIAKVDSPVVAAICVRHDGPEYSPNLFPMPRRFLGRGKSDTALQWRTSNQRILCSLRISA